jgi:hypothetical protein
MTILIYAPVCVLVCIWIFYACFMPSRSHSSSLYFPNNNRENVKLWRHLLSHFIHSPVKYLSWSPNILEAHSTIFTLKSETIVVFLWQVPWNASLHVSAGRPVKCSCQERTCWTVHHALMTTMTRVSASRHVTNNSHTISALASDHLPMEISCTRC